ncbi:MAG: YceD family protein, partial [Victivallaceae bacterium]
DVSDDVRIEMVLFLPINILCSDDCRGLCPHCGCDLNAESCDCEVENAAEAEVPGDEAENPWSALDNLKL